MQSSRRNHLLATLSEQQKSALHQHCSLIVKEPFNLVGKNDLNDLERLHTQNCLLLLDYLPANCQHIIDIGSGAGFPGIVLSICLPNTKVHLIESNRKKAAFLQKLVQKLNIPNAHIYHFRAEEHLDQLRKFNAEIVLGRFVTNLTTMYRHYSTLANSDGGKLMLLKPGDAHPELMELNKKYPQITYQHIQNFDEIGQSRSLFIFQRDKRTNNEKLGQGKFTK